MKTDEIHLLYEYHYATFDCIWDSAMQLTDEQFTASDGYAWDSVRNHLLHVSSAEHRWIARIEQRPLPDPIPFEDYPDARSARARWNETANSVIWPYINALDESKLDDMLHFDFPHRGGMKRARLWQVLVHIVNHGTDHRAQVLALLHKHGAPTFEQDFMLYLWDKDEL